MTTRRHFLSCLLLTPAAVLALPENPWPVRKIYLDRCLTTEVSGLRFEWERDFLLQNPTPGLDWIVQELAGEILDIDGVTFRNYKRHYTLYWSAPIGLPEPRKAIFFIRCQDDPRYFDFTWLKNVRFYRLATP